MSLAECVPRLILCSTSVCIQARVQEFSTIVDILLSGIFVGSPDFIFTVLLLLQYVSQQNIVKRREIKAFQQKLLIMANEM